MPSNYHADQVDLNVKAAVTINAKDGSPIYELAGAFDLENLSRFH